VDQNFVEFLASLSAESVDYLLIGGYAVGVHAQPRATKDLDIFIRCDAANALALWRALAKFGAPGLEELTPDYFAQSGNGYRMGIAPYMIEVITRIDGVEFADARPRAVYDETFGLRVPVISAEDLIINKLAAGRLQDLADVAAVRQAAKQRPSTALETIYDRHPGLTHDVEPERDDDLTRDPPGRGRRR
jgi:hypothetical protein